MSRFTPSFGVRATRARRDSTPAFRERARLVRVAEHDAEAVALRRPRLRRVRVDENDGGVPRAGGAQGSGERASDRIRPDDREPVVGRFPYPQQARHEPARPAEDDDGDGDDEEDHGSQLAAFRLHPAVGEFRREQRGDGEGDDPARSQPGQERLLVTAQARAPGTEEHAEGTDDGHEDDHGHDPARAQRPYVAEVHRRRQEDE